MGQVYKNTATKMVGFDGGVDEYHHPWEVAANRKVSAFDIHIDGGKLKKRPGKEPWGPLFVRNDQLDVKCTGLHEHIDPDGVARLLVACSDGKIREIIETAAHLYTDNINQFGRTIIRDTGLEDGRLHFITHRGRCRYVGAATHRKITRTLAAPVGIDAPAASELTVAEGSSASFSGNYSYKITACIFENGVVVWESNPSVAESVTVSGKAVNVTVAIDDATVYYTGANGFDQEPFSETRINGARIYRTTNGGAVWLYLYEEQGRGFTYSDETADANLGAVLETNHGVSAQPDYIEGANERLFWIDGEKLRWSEMAHTEAYLEYQSITNFRELPYNGMGTGLKRMYNVDSGRDDLYIFQERAVSVLPNADPNSNIHTLSSIRGCASQDSIVEYRGGLVFLSGQRTVEYITGNRLIDISSRAIPDSMQKLVSTSTATAGLIFDHYYALCCTNDAWRGYNSLIWVCDLRTVSEVKAGYADATWYCWRMNADYILQRNNGDVVCFDNNRRRLWKLKNENYQDYADDLSKTPSQISATFKTGQINFGAFKRFQPKVLRLIGTQTGTIAIKAIYGDAYLGNKLASVDAEVRGGQISTAG